MNGTVVVTGGSGFIGTHLVDLLERDPGVRIVNLDLEPPRKERHSPYWIPCDILNPSVLKNVFAEARPRFVAHLAGRTDMNGKTVEDYRVNSVGTENVIEAIRNASSVERAVFVSSQFVVGPGPLPRNELDFRAHTIYGESKVLAELAVRNSGLQCTWTIVRPTNVWGSWHPRYPREFWRVLQKGMYLHPGSGMVTRSYGYVGNVVRQMKKILELPSDAIHKHVLYVGDPPIALLDWVNAFSLQLTGHRARVIPQSLLRLLAYVGDCLVAVGVKFPLFSSRLRSMTEDYPTPMEPTFALLGPPATSLEDGVRETVQWLRSIQSKSPAAQTRFTASIEKGVDA
ncbi:MAG TPA: NAD(P)-dependent oxidoreductase [Terracidiphilus sp.]|nr:NAD(P)-dependent oxidoreductase [Terracidiphilus sp.]